MKEKFKYNFKEGLIDSLLTTFIIIILILITPAFLFNINLLHPFMNAFEDIQITDVNYSKLRDPSIVPADTNIVIFDIEDLNPLGLRMLLMKLIEHEPKVLAIDKILEKSENELDNIALRELLKEFDNLVLPSRLINPDFKNLRCDSIYYGELEFHDIAVYGFTNLIDENQKEFKTVREFNVGFNVGDNFINSFPVQIARLYDESAYKDLIERGNINEIINYRGDIKKFSFANGDDIVKHYEDLEFVRGKIVLLGVDGFFRGYDLLEDLYYTPMNRNTAGRTFPDMSQVTISANIISMVLARNYLNSMPKWLGYIIAVVICFLTCLVFDYISKRNRKWYEISSLLIFVIVSIFLLFLTLIIFDFYNYQLRLTEALFTIALAVFVYQIYSDSIKPITLKIYNILRKG